MQSTLYISGDETPCTNKDAFVWITATVSQVEWKEVQGCRNTHRLFIYIFFFGNDKINSILTTLKIIGLAAQTI